MEGRPLAQWVGTRWDISRDDTLLNRAVKDHLKVMHDFHPKPEKGVDYRARLYDAAFVRGTASMVRLDLKPISFGAFDQSPYLLGLPDCKVVDLRTGQIRTMERSDYVTQRVKVAPDANGSTRRFDQFIAEITLNDAGLSAYLLRLAALCLTAVPEQKLFFLWGHGRNGKGVFVNVLTSILGDRLAWSLNPGDVTTTRFGDDQMKRVFADIAGRRLVTVNESVGDRLNFSMLKLMSGGDALRGAKMRQDAVTIKPTHKLLLPTNERPKLPADAAFKGRVHMIPFRASFLAKPDPFLSDKLKAELPGILHKLITLSPDAIANGLRPPAVVLEETEELFDEQDIAKQFAGDCLEFNTEARTTAEDMQAALTRWLHSGLTVGNTDVDQVLKDLKNYPAIAYKRVRVNELGKSGRGSALRYAYVGFGLKKHEE